jgi:hypothetical protein
MTMLLAALGVIAPALLLVMAVRKWLEPVSWKLTALFLLLSLAVVGRGIFTSGVPVPLDEVVRGYPYRGIFGEVVAQNYLTNDTVKQILPWMQTAREQMFAGRAPLWNPHLFSGYPLLGNGQSAPYSPFFLATLFVPLPKQIVAMAGLKLFAALLFGFLLLRREGVSVGAALFGCTVFTFAIFNNVFLYYPMTAVTLLLPAAAYAVLFALRSRRAAPHVLVALVVASLLAGGHPESVVHVATAVVVLLSIEWFAPRWASARFTWRDFARVTVAAILGLLISAPAWVPVVEQAAVSVRVDSLRSVPAAPVFPATALWAILNPDGFGNPARQNWSWIFSYTHVASLYLGLIVTALIPVTVFSRRSTLRERLLIGWCVLFFFAAMKWGIVAKLFYAAPPLSWVAHDRFRFVICFFAGIAVAHVIGRMTGWDIAMTAVFGSGLIALGVYVLTIMKGRGLFQPELVVGVVALVLFLVAAALWRRHLAALAFALAAIELFVFNYPYNAVISERYYVPRLPIIEALRTDARDLREPFRVLGLDWVFLPNAAAQYGLEDIRGSDPMQWGDYGRFLRTAAVKDAWIEDVKRIADASHPIIDFLNVRYLLVEPGMQPGPTWTRVYAGADGELYRNGESKPRFFVPPMMRRVGRGEWESELAGGGDFVGTPLVSGAGVEAVVVNPKAEVAVALWGPTSYRLNVTAAGPAVVASSHPAMRWWTVTVNGRRTPILRVNGAFMGFRVPAGSSVVRIRYRPWSFWGAVAVGLGALAGLALGSRLVPKTVE